MRIEKPLIRLVESPEAVFAIDDSIDEKPSRTKTHSNETQNAPNITEPRKVS
jgi:hypothetical protein